MVNEFVYFFFWLAHLALYWAGKLFGRRFRLWVYKHYDGFWVWGIYQLKVDTRQARESYEKKAQKDFPIQQKEWDSYFLRVLRNPASASSRENQDV